jgi:hypothetical protein
MEGKTWSLVTGYFGDRLYLSIRTTNPRADAGGLMRRLIGRRGKGGGHGMIAGGWIDAGKVAAPAERRELQRKLGQRMARELKKNPEKMGKVELRTLSPSPSPVPAPARRPSSPRPSSPDPGEEGDRS